MLSRDFVVASVPRIVASVLRIVLRWWCRSKSCDLFATVALAVLVDRWDERVRGGVLQTHLRRTLLGLFLVCMFGHPGDQHLFNCIANLKCLVHGRSRLKNTLPPPSSSPPPLFDVV